MIAVGVHAVVVRGGAAERAMSEVRGVQVGMAPASVEELGARAAQEKDELPPCCREVHSPRGVQSPRGAQVASDPIGGAGRTDR
jgi:hypothetical protein